MAEIKNLHLLTHLTEEQITTLEIRALRHRRQANLHFKILKANPGNVTVAVRQEKRPDDDVPLCVKELADIAKELFDGYYLPADVRAQTLPFAPRPVEAVTPSWVKARMKQTGTNLRTLAEDTGLDRSSLSAIITGNRPMSNITRAMFFFYFQSKSPVVPQ